jgi:hypothetical protein
VVGLGGFAEFGLKPAYPRRAGDTELPNFLGIASGRAGADCSPGRPNRRCDGGAVLIAGGSGHQVRHSASRWSGPRNFDHLQFGTGNVLRPLRSPKAEKRRPLQESPWSRNEKSFVPFFWPKRRQIDEVTGVVHWPIPLNGVNYAINCGKSRMAVLQFG